MNFVPNPALDEALANKDIEELYGYAVMLQRGFEWAVMQSTAKPPRDIEVLVNLARRQLSETPEVVS